MGSSSFWSARAAAASRRSSSCSPARSCRTSGQIAVNGFSLTNIAERQIPLLRRSVGVIFQDFRLIEKKTVYENLGFAMRAVGSSPREIKKRIPYVLELVGLEEKTDR